MKSFIFVALIVASVQATPGGLAGYSYTTGAGGPAVAYAAGAPAIAYAGPAAASTSYRFDTINTPIVAPAVTYAAQAIAPAPAVAYAAPAATSSVYRYDTVNNAVTYAAAAPVATYAAAAPAFAYGAPAAVAIPAAIKTQYHAQDVLGQASYGYSYPGQAHHVVRDAAGNERGSYAYASPAGEIRVDYVADEGGFRAASNALPQAPLHLAPHAVAHAPFAVHVPQVPADTPEVVEARIAHAAAHVEAKARNLVLRKKRGAIGAPLAYSAATYGAAPFAYAATHVNHGYNTAIQHPSFAVHHPVATYAAAFAPAATYAIHNKPGHGYSYQTFL